MEKYGIDISHWNNITNYDTLANNTDFVILKAGGSDKYAYKNNQYTDNTFEERYRELKKRGVPIGCYYFIGRKTINKIIGEKDARHFLNIIKGKKFEYPVVVDAESNAPSDKEGATRAVIAFCDLLEKAGYYAMVYGSDLQDFRDSLNLKKLDAYDKWVARYGNKPQYVKKYGIWQTSSKGKCAGIVGVVDKDTAYKDYPKIMKKYHLNGY